MSVTVRLLLFVGTAVVFLTLGRWRVVVRSRRLRELVDSTGADWAALARVRSGGETLDGHRRRRGMGPRGILTACDLSLEWLPDPYERKHGDATRRWPIADVVCLTQTRRRDISGLGYTQMRLRFPEGVADIAVFGQVGVLPAALDVQPPRR